MHEPQCKRGMKDVVANVNGDDLPGCHPETHGAVADAVNETCKPGVADDAQCSAGRTHGRCRRIVPRLKENRFDDIHWKFRRQPCATLQLNVADTPHTPWETQPRPSIR
jgi:hypothetical protein